MGDNYNSGSSSSGIGFYFVLILLIAGLCVCGYFFYKSMNEEKPVIIDETEEQLAVVRYNMRLVIKGYDDKYLSANYTLKQLFLEQQKGIIYKDIVEVFSNATYNLTYDLYADNGEYYFGKTSCLNSEMCIVKLDKVAETIFTAVKLDNTNIQLVLKVSDGLVRQPMICVSYSPNVFNFEIENFDKVSKPIRLSNTYDRCYDLRGDLGENSYYYVARYNTTNMQNNITFILVDKGYNNNYDLTYEVDNELPDMTVFVT